MESFSFQALEWPHLLDQLAKHATTHRGAELCRQLPLAIDRAGAYALQQETAEIKALLLVDGAIPLGGIRDIRDSVARARQGAGLEPRALLEIGTTQRAARMLKQYAQSRAEQAPRFWEIASPLPLLAGLAEAIEQSFRQDGTIHDNASAELARIRAELRETQSRIRIKLQRMIQSTQYRSAIQEGVISQRNGRYLLPVKVEGQSVIKGLIHDQSASGATVYLEPMAIVEDNNLLKKLEAGERAEIERILAVLSGMVARDADPLLAQNDLLTHLDALVARGAYALAIGAEAPQLNEHGLLRLDRARHPLLIAQFGRERVVPLDLELPFGESLVVTGPNTGGKTVALKTTGLLALMAKAGLHIPAEPSSQVPIFSLVLADIGDEQSLQQSLSTFSGHMTHLVEILRHADGESLVLMDELGTGTDPSEGAALAQAIIETLRDRAVTTVVTTHYGSLKALAFNRSGIHNAATEFDEETLAPTYRFLMGQPGRSNALAISRRLGLTPAVIERAQALIGVERQDLEHVIAQLAQEAEALRRERDALASERAKAEAERQALETKQETLEAEIDKFRKGSQHELGQDIHAARQQVAELVRKLQQAGTAQAAQQVKDRLDEIASRQLSRSGASGAKVDWRPGQAVFVPRLSTGGTVLSSPDSSGQVQVQIGALKTFVAVEDLRPPKGGVKLPKPAKRHTAPSIPVKDVSWELDLRGKMAAEAIAELEKFLDDAISSNHQKLYIIHGKGTGALRAAVQDYLKHSPYVGYFRGGNLPEGGAGVTVVELA